MSEQLNTPTLDTITIRTDLRPGDIGWVIYRHGVLYKEENNYGVEFESYVAAGLHEFFLQFNPLKNRVWVCEYHDSIIGFLLLIDRGTSAQLRYFYIERAFRGIGLGKKLMDLYIETLHEFGYKQSYLWTTKELSAAANLYTRSGFILAEEKVSFTFGKEVTEQKYVLEL